MRSRLRISICLTLAVTCTLQFRSLAQVPSRDTATMTAEAITVRLEGATQGSGVLIQRLGTVHTVLTAWHVLRDQSQGEAIDVITPDGKSHRMLAASIRRIPDADLAVLEFSSPENYQVATIASAEHTSRKSSLLIAGYPHGAAEIKITAGLLFAAARMQMEDGYQLIYSNPTSGGMSGGPVLNRQGQLIGIHGRGEEDRNSEGLGEGIVKTGLNQGMPISHYIRFRDGQTSGAWQAQETLDDWIAQWARLWPNANSQGDFEQLNAIAKQALRHEASVETECMLFRSIQNTVIAGSGPDSENREEISRRILLHKPISADDFICRAVAYSTLGNLSEANAEYSRGIASYPGVDGLHLARGGLWHGQALQHRLRKDQQAALMSYKNAIADYSRAIELNSINNRFPSGYAARASLHSEFNQHEAAIRDQQEVVRVLAKDPWSHMMMAQYRSRAGDRIGACRQLQTVEQLLPLITANVRRTGIDQIVLLLLKQHECDSHSRSSELPSTLEARR